MSEATLQPDNTTGQDSYINSSSPDTNYGSSSIMYIQNTDNQPSFIKFSDLTDYIGKGYTINSAILTIYSITGSGTINLYRLTSDWDESTITYNNQPSVDGTLITSAARAGSGYNNFTITDLVQNWCNETYSNYGVVLKSSNTGFARTSEYITDSALRPKLYINYTSEIIIETTKTNIDINTTSITVTRSSTGITTKSDVTISTSNISLSLNSIFQLTKSNILINTQDIILSLGFSTTTTKSNILINTTSITVTRSSTGVTTKSNVTINTSDINLSLGITKVTTKSNITIDTIDIVVNINIRNILYSFYAQSYQKTYYVNNINRTFNLRQLDRIFYV
jgi:hypothetical protein